MSCCYRTRNILDDFREAYFWLRQNTDDKSRVMSWWDYGYQIAGMGNRTTLVDNNTWNNSHIALVTILLISHRYHYRFNDHLSGETVSHSFLAPPVEKQKEWTFGDVAQGPDLPKKP